MRSIFLLGLLTILGAGAHAQGSLMNHTTRDQINFSGLVIPATGVLYGVAGEPGKLLGDTYFDTTFQAGNVRFYGRIGASDSLGGVPLRYDLLNQEVEVRASPRDIRAARAPLVRSFVQNNRQGGTSKFINVREFRGEADALIGFFESWVAGPLHLLKQHTVLLKRANFNAALNVGTKDDELLKKEEWFVAREGRATRFTPSRKALLALMADKEPAIEAYLKTHRPNLRSEADLAAVFRYYNGL